MQTASTIAASLFFKNVFGGSGAARGLNVLILLSAFGNLISNLIGASRIIRECGRFVSLLPYFLFLEWNEIGEETRNANSDVMLLDKEYSHTRNSGLLRNHSGRRLALMR